MAARNDEVLERLVERVDGRYYGKYRGVVKDVEDPLKLGRLRANVPRLLGTGTTGWALPAFPFTGPKQGVFVMPPAGASVWIEFEEGDLGFPIWSGGWFAKDQLPDEAATTSTVLRTAAGHVVVLDDKGKKLTITDANGNAIAMDGSQIAIKAGKATKIVVDAPSVELAGGGHPVAFGDVLQQYLQQLAQIYQTHMHSGQTATVAAFGTPGPVTPAPPTPPFPPVPPTLSSKKVLSG